VSATRRPIPVETTFADPVTTTPARRPRSIRRTTTHESTRPQGFDGPVTLVARGRDLVTGADGTASVVDEARVEIEAAFTDGIVRRLSVDPADARLDQLVGTSAYAGMRRRVEEVLPGEMSSGSVRAQLVDDLSTTLMLSGRALRVAGLPMGMDGRSGSSPADMCAGWAADGMAMALRTDLGPPLTVGPPAPAVERNGDPQAWHPIDQLPPWSTRRRRRLDVWEHGGAAAVDCFFRDSFVDEEGLETVVHEWSVTAEVDTDAGRVSACSASLGPLPFLECPGSAASAGRLVGLDLADLRRTVRKTFVGPTTCTHLNDTLRSLEDVGTLLDRLRSHAD
jgi:hypothetical protein